MPCYCGYPANAHSFYSASHFADPKSTLHCDNYSPEQYSLVVYVSFVAAGYTRYLTHPLLNVRPQREKSLSRYYEEGFAVHYFLLYAIAPDIIEVPSYPVRAEQQCS